MSFNATALNIMIASPGDVDDERRTVEKVLARWNATHSLSRKLILMPVGWETHSTPRLGERPQSLINQQMLDDCDILVGVFWTRLGSPTGDFASGTVEEITRHVEADKPAMIYFSEQPAHLQSVNQEQYTALKDFR